MKLLLSITLLFLFTFSAQAFESFQYENKGSSSATEILSKSTLDLGVMVEGDTAKAIYLKIKNEPNCENEDATSTLCKKVGESVACNEQMNSRGRFYSCSFLVDSQGKVSPQKF